MDAAQDVVQPNPLPPPSEPSSSVLQGLSGFVQRLPAWMFALLALIVIFFSYQILGGLLLLMAFGLDVTAVHITAYRLATMVGQFVFILIPTVILAKLRFPHVKNVFRFGAVHPGQIALVILSVFALQQLLQGYMMMQEAAPIHLPPVIQDFVDKIKTLMEQMYRQLTAANSLPEFLFVVLVIAVTPAICEEVMFRGLIQRTLEEPSPTASQTPDPFSEGSRTGGGMKAAVIAGIVFGLYHLNPFSLVPLIVLGIFFGLVAFRTQNIVPAMVAHFFNNFLACLAVYLKLDDDFLAIAPTVEPTAELLALNTAASSLVFVAATWYLIRLTKPKKSLDFA